jgi:hypothetical protein
MDWFIKFLTTSVSIEYWEIILMLAILVGASYYMGWISYQKSMNKKGNVIKPK